MRRLSLAAGLVLIVAVAPGVAAANTATIGSALSQPSNVNGISTGSITVQRSQVGGSSPHPLTSPVDGVVTEWAVVSRDFGAIYSLRILRPAGPTTYLAAGTAVAPTAAPGGSTTILRYPASLPIRQGDAIGLTPGGDSDAGIPQADTPGLTANLMALSVGGAPDGGTASFTSMEAKELLLQATVKFCEVPNLQGKKLKAAKRALAAADCAAKVSKKKGAKKKQRGKVIKQKQKAGFTAPPGTQIPIVVGKK